MSEKDASSGQANLTEALLTTNAEDDNQNIDVHGSLNQSIASEKGNKKENDRQEMEEDSHRSGELRKTNINRT